jgi:hypothetical protein
MTCSFERDGCERHVLTQRDAIFGTGVNEVYGTLVQGVRPAVIHPFWNGLACAPRSYLCSFTVQPSARRPVFAAAVAVPVIRISREVTASSSLARAADSVVIL